MADLQTWVGDEFEIRADLEKRTHSGTGSSYSAATALSPDSATVIVLRADPDDVTTGTVDSGTATTITDATFTQAADFWNGCMVEFTSGSNKGEQRQVTDFASGGTFTLRVTGDPLPATPAAGDTFQVLGYPIISETDLDDHADGVLSSNKGYFVLTPANGGTSTPGRRFIFFRASFDGESGDTNVFTERFSVVVRSLW